MDALRSSTVSYALGLLCLAQCSIAYGQGPAGRHLARPVTDAIAIEQIWAPTGADELRKPKPVDGAKLKKTKEAMKDAGIARLEALGHRFLKQGWIALDLGEHSRALEYQEAANAVMPGAIGTSRLGAAIRRSASPTPAQMRPDLSTNWKIRESGTAASAS